MPIGYCESYELPSHTVHFNSFSKTTTKGMADKVTLEAQGTVELEEKEIAD